MHPVAHWNRCSVPPDSNNGVRDIYKSEEEKRAQKHSTAWQHRINKKLYSRLVHTYRPNCLVVYVYLQTNGRGHLSPSPGTVTVTAKQKNSEHPLREKHIFNKFNLDAEEKPVYAFTNLTRLLTSVNSDTSRRRFLQPVLVLMKNGGLIFLLLQCYIRLWPAHCRDNPWFSPSILLLHKAKHKSGSM